MERFEAFPLQGERGLRLTGELDLHSVKQLKDAVARMSGAGPAKLVVSELEFVDSSGLHAIVELARSENGNGPLILDGVSPSLLRILDVTCLAQHPDLDIRVALDGR